MKNKNKQKKFMPRSIIDFSVELHWREQDMPRYYMALARRHWIRSRRLHGDDHPLTRRYKAIFDRRWRYTQYSLENEKRCVVNLMQTQCKDNVELRLAVAPMLVHNSSEVRDYLEALSEEFFYV